MCQPNQRHLLPFSLPRCRLSSGRHRHTAVSCYTSFPCSQDEFDASASSSNNVSSYRLPSRAETKALNLHHRRRSSSSDSPTPTLHYYKNVISILPTLPITQLHLYFVSSLARAQCHRSSTHRHCSLSPTSHAHHPSAQ
jgi:hypothetical protein